MPKAEIPDLLKCPINKSLFTDPVSTSDGQTYERKAIKKWIDQNSSTDVKSPMTNLRLAHVGLCINLHMLNEVKAFKASLIDPGQLEDALLKSDLKTLDECSFMDEQFTVDMIAKVVLHNSVQSLQWLSNQNIDAVTDPTLVFLAVEYGAFEVTKWYFHHNPNCKVLVLDKRYSLLDYARDGHMFQFLLQKGVQCNSTSVEIPNTCNLYCPSVPRFNRSLETFKLLYTEKKKMRKDEEQLGVEELDYLGLIDQLPEVLQYYWDQQTPEKQISMLLSANMEGDMLLHYTAWKGKKEMLHTVLSIYKQASTRGAVPTQLMDVKSSRGDTVLHSICYREVPDVEFLKFMKSYMGTAAFIEGLSIMNKNNLTAGQILSTHSRQTSKSEARFTFAMKLIIEHCPLDCYFTGHNTDQWRLLIQHMMNMMMLARVKRDDEEEMKKKGHDGDAAEKGTKRRHDEKETCDKPCETKESAFKKLKT